MAKRARRTGWSIRRRLLVSYLLLGVVAAGVTTTGALFLRRLDDAVNRRATLYQPAEIRNADLLTALLDQETGVRGYAVTGNRANLDPYNSGLTEQTTYDTRLHQQLDGDPRLAADLRAVDQRAATWQATYARPLIARVSADGPPAAHTVDPLAGKPQFDAIRTATTTLDNDLLARSRTAKSQISTAFDVIIALLSVAFGLLVLAVVAVYVATRRWIVLPLDSVSADARGVAEGDLDRPISLASAPPDLLDLADDMEAMRLRLIEEIEGVELARTAIAASEELLRVQAENLERSNRDLEQFAYVASHDLQEPLRKVASFCQLLERRYSGQLDERGEQYIAFAVDGAKRMQQLIADLLSFSRVGRTTEAFTEVDLATPVGRAVAALSSALESTGGRVEVGALPVVLGDVGLLTQLFQNLLGNAVKFHGDEPPVVTVSAERAGEEWVLAVRDNGIGIEPAYAEKIFVIFQRLHSRESAYSGTGIGLALCRRIVEFHGGRIWLDTTGDAPGTCFRVALPVATSSAAPVTPAVDATTAAAE